jgi:hypothetical protein
MKPFAALAALLLPLAALAQDPNEDPKPDKATMKLIERTRELRGLEFKTNPKVRYWDVEDLRKMMREDFDEELPAEKAKTLEFVMAAFGLVPEGYDLRKEFFDLMMEQIAGFYHPEKKLLCLIEGKAGTGPEQDIVTVHELNHALQDQHFDLTRIHKLGQGNDDLAAAVKALIEGEATMVMFDHMFESQGGMTCDRIPGIEALIDAQMRAAGGMAGAEKLGKAPPVIREGMVGAYIDGFKFVVGVKRKKGWEGVNAMWKDLPASMEQVLHPERYLERDMPQRGTFPKDLAVPEGWEKVEENVHGEFGVRMVFHTLKPKSKESGTRAAEGWDGDVYRVYRKDGKPLILWATVWDTETDAREFAVAYTKILAKKAGGLDVKADGRGFVAAGANGGAAMARDGRKVWFVEGGPAESAEGLLKAIQEGTTFEEVAPGIGGETKSEEGK